ncbi:MAG: chloride channel protein [Acidipropionibacterium sp.]|nr:chloride channel protein [Acidipropionibacterium sp.]
MSRLTRRNRADLRLLVAAGAAAGLTTAFNAPIAGGVFILEELVKKFEPRTAVATLLASGSGFLAATLITGSSGPDFTTVPMGSPSVRHLPIILLVGLLAGLLGVAYNKMVLGGLKVVDGSRLPPEFWGGTIGALVGAIAFVAPDLVGGGDPLTQRALLSEGSIAVVAGILVARIALGVVSYSAATSGGLFAPMLVVGSHLGLLVGPGRPARRAAVDAAARRAGPHRHGGAVHRHGARADHRHGAGHRAHRGEQASCHRCWGPARWRWWSPDGFTAGRSTTPWPIVPPRRPSRMPRSRRRGAPKAVGATREMRPHQVGKPPSRVHSQNIRKPR